MLLFVFLICRESYADEARVYCINATGSWNWLYKKRGIINFFDISSYIMPIIKVEGEWKRQHINDGILRYFIIAAGVESFSMLEKKCQQAYGVDYHAQPKHSLNNGYYPFAISDDNIILNGYVVLDSNVGDNGLQFWFRQ